MFEAWFWRMAAPFCNWAHKVYLMSCLEEKFQLSELFLCFTLHCRCLQMFTNLVDSFTLVSCRRSQLDLLHLLIFISNISEILYKQPGRLRHWPWILLYISIIYNISAFFEQVNNIQCPVLPTRLNKTKFLLSWSSFLLPYQGPTWEVLKRARVDGCGGVRRCSSESVRRNKLLHFLIKMVYFLTYVWNWQHLVHISSWW